MLANPGSYCQLPSRTECFAVRLQKIFCSDRLWKVGAIIARGIGGWISVLKVIVLEGGTSLQ